MISCEALLSEVRACTLCVSHLPHGVRPILQLHAHARILIVGQAPGKKVHTSGIPFDDASGARLREWMGVSPEVFYNPEYIALLPMGLCFPGLGRSGDLPPRPECAPTWHPRLLAYLQHLDLTLLLGQYAQAYYLGQRRASVTDAVQGWRTSWPRVVPLPHPSPRNNLWLRRHPWFEAELLPALRSQVAQILSSPLHTTNDSQT